jgi:hypothetical protein
MKQALVFSDSHGRLDNLLDVLKQYPSAEAVFFLGDVQGDASRLRNATPYPVYMVRGNCDYDMDIPQQLVTEFAGKKIALCHGHRYLDYGGVDSLRYWALEKKADIGMFGHTHVPYLEEGEKLTLLNPGSISRPRQEGHIPTYAVMEVEEDGKVTFHQCSYVKKSGKKI